jgi:hypothetical protein
MAVPTFISAGSVATDITGAASTTPTPPTHQAGDLLIVVAINAANSSMTTSTGGWTIVVNDTQLTSLLIAWKVATAAGTAGPTITAAATDQFAICYVFRGVGSKSVGSLVTLINAQPEFYAFTGISQDILSVCFCTLPGDATFSSGNPPSGWTSNSNIHGATGTGYMFSVISRGDHNPLLINGDYVGTATLTAVWDTVLVFLSPNAIIGTIIQKNQAVNRSNYY